MPAFEQFLALLIRYLQRKQLVVVIPKVGAPYLAKKPPPQKPKEWHGWPTS